MARPLITTKLYVPKPRRGLVDRARLRRLLRSGGDAKLTLVSAPAGFGKTTLLADWFDQSSEDDRSVAWLSLDAGDREPAVLWTYVVTALQAAVHGVDSGTLDSVTLSSLPADQLLTAVVNELADSPRAVWLVLDDYHLVDGAEVGEDMTFLIEHLPPAVHIVLSTRADPELPLSRWRVRGELVEVRAADLRFTSDEATTYLNDVSALNLPVEDVAALAERTEGWIAALQLAALTLQGRPDVHAFIAGFSGNDRYVVDYLVEEVLRHQPPPVQQFLLATAVLDRLSGPLCDALTGRDDGSHTLVALERANLFIVALDDRREWYRYHHLFADVLRARMLAEQPESASPLHQRASRWYESAGLAEEAVRHALAASDFDRAAHLVEAAVPTMRRLRQDAMLSHWLRALPAAVVRRSPVLSVFYGSMLAVAGDLDAVEGRLRDAELAFAAAADGSAPSWADSEELRTLPATIAVHRAALAQARGDVAGTAEHARQALALSGPNDHLSRGGAAGFLGLAAWAQGDVRDALSAFTQAVAALHAAGNLVDELNSTVLLSDMWLTAGRPSEARRLYHRALQLEAEGGPAGATAADLHVGLAELASEVGQVDAATEHLEVAAALADRAPAGTHGYRWFVAMSRVAEAAGDGGEAIRYLDQAERLYQRGFVPDVRPIPAMKARVWITHGQLSLASGWASDAAVSVTDDVRFLGEFDLLTLVRLLLARYRQRPVDGGLTPVTELLARMLLAAVSAGRAGSVLEIRMLQALASLAQGHRQDARESLQQALTEAPEPDGYGRLFTDEGAPMTELLRDCDHAALVGEQTQRLLLLGQSTHGHLGHSSQRPMPFATSLSGRELQVLRLLSGDLTGPQIADELFLSHNTVRTHTKHIFRKLDVTTRRAAVRRAREGGLL